MFAFTGLSAEQVESMREVSFDDPIPALMTLFLLAVSTMPGSAYARILLIDVGWWSMVGGARIPDERWTHESCWASFDPGAVRRRGNEACSCGDCLTRAH